MPSTSKKTKWDIVLSYHWGTGMQYARALKECLEGFGYAVWIDYDALEESNVLSEMKTAITNCAVVIRCISDGYKYGKSCAREICMQKINPSI